MRCTSTGLVALTDYLQELGARTPARDLRALLRRHPELRREMEIVRFAGRGQRPVPVARVEALPRFGFALLRREPPPVPLARVVPLPAPELKPAPEAPPLVREISKLVSLHGPAYVGEGAGLGPAAVNRFCAGATLPPQAVESLAHYLMAETGAC